MLGLPRLLACMLAATACAMPAAAQAPQRTVRWAASETLPFLLRSGSASMASRAFRIRLTRMR